MVPKSSEARAWSSFSRAVFAPFDVRGVVLVVVQLEDPGRVVRLERGVVVRELGERVFGHAGLLGIGLSSAGIGLGASGVVPGRRS